MTSKIKGMHASQPKPSLNRDGDRTTPAPLAQKRVIASLPQLASQLFDDCQNDLRPPGPEVHGGKTMGELFEEEKSCLLSLQSERFAPCCRRCTFVDGHALVRFSDPALQTGCARSRTSGSPQDSSPLRKPAEVNNAFLTHLSQPV